MRLRVLSVLVTMAAEGCAGTGRGDGVESANAVQLTVRRLQAGL